MRVFTVVAPYGTIRILQQFAITKTTINKDYYKNKNYYNKDDYNEAYNQLLENQLMKK